MDDEPTHGSRPYHWGAIYLCDADCEADFDIDFHTGTCPVLATTAHVAATVLHPAAADDGEADVSLDVRVQAVPAAGMAYEARLDMPSGRLYIGDADESDELTLPAAGRWLLQFAVDDPNEAREVRLVLSPL